jgi:hypothetical protein
MDTDGHRYFFALSEQSKQRLSLLSGWLTREAQGTVCAHLRTSVIENISRGCTRMGTDVFCTSNQSDTYFLCALCCLCANGHQSVREKKFSQRYLRAMRAQVYRSTGSWYTVKNENGETFSARIKRDIQN